MTKKGILITSMIPKTPPLITNGSLVGWCRCLVFCFGKLIDQRSVVATNVILVAKRSYQADGVSAHLASGLGMNPSEPGLAFPPFSISIESGLVSSWGTGWNLGYRKRRDHSGYSPFPRIISDEAILE